MFTWLSFFFFPVINKTAVSIFLYDFFCVITCHKHLIIRGWSPLFRERIKNVTAGLAFGISWRWGDGQGSLACCSPWGHRESDTTEWLNWTGVTEVSLNAETFSCLRPIGTPSRTLQFGAFLSYKLTSLHRGRKERVGNPNQPFWGGAAPGRVGLQSAQGLRPGWPRPTCKDYRAAVYPEDSPRPDPKSVGNGFKIWTEFSRRPLFKPAALLAQR